MSKMQIPTAAARTGYFRPSARNFRGQIFPASGPEIPDVLTLFPTMNLLMLRLFVPWTRVLTPVLPTALSLFLQVVVHAGVESLLPLEVLTLRLMRQVPSQKAAKVPLQRSVGAQRTSLYSDLWTICPCLSFALGVQLSLMRYRKRKTLIPVSGLLRWSCCTERFISSCLTSTRFVLTKSSTFSN